MRGETRELNPDYLFSSDVIRQEASPIARFGVHAGSKLNFAYFAVALFTIVYFGRPEDWIPGTQTFPFAKITGLLAILAFALGVLSGRRLVLTTEIRALLALFIQLCLAIPFSTWMGGSFDIVVLQFSKVVLITLVLLQAVSTIERLKQIIFLHTLTVVVVAAISIKVNATMGSRMTGAVGGIFGNPNDLAANISLIFPFALAFFFLTKSRFKKILWLVALGALADAVVATYSRGGFLSLSVVIAVCVLYLKGKQRGFVLTILAVGMVLGMLAMTASDNYVDRLQSIVNPDLDSTGSSAARSQLLMKSLDLTASHPLFGIGPGQFAVASGNWHVAHNSYTELSSEAGIPAALLFLWMLYSSLKCLRRVRKNRQASSEVHMLSVALSASLLGFIVALFFASLEYLFLPYFLVAYVAALRILTERAESTSLQSPMSSLPQTEQQTCVE